MNIFVVDTNIVFSGILNTNSKIGQILIKGPGGATFFSTTFLRSEISRHRPKLQKITRLDMDDLLELESLVTHKIIFIDESLVAEEWILKAEELLFDIDIDDAPFLALALQMDCKIWTGDKKLREGLLQKGFNAVLNTEELDALLQETPNVE
jgi:predicted nucleic acid-binding protein